MSRLMKELPVQFTSCLDTLLETCTLSQCLEEVCRARGIHLRKLQMLIIQHLSSGADVEVIGGCKQGRTSGVLIAVLALLMLKSGHKGSPGALFITSTKEAAWSAYDFAVSLSTYCHVKVQPLIAGREDSKIFASSVDYDLVIATPGRVLGALEETNLRPTSLRYLILDDAHDLLGDTGSGVHTESLLPLLPKDTVRAVISNIKVSSAGPHLRALPRLVVRVSGSLEKFRLQHAPVKHGKDTNEAILRYSNSVGPREKQLIFAPTVSAAASIQVYMHNHLPDRRICLAHKKIDDPSRFAAITSFNRGDSSILVTCRIASAGIDLEDVDHVVFSSPPQDWARILGAMHQCGRTKSGAVVVLYKEDDEADCALKDMLVERFTTRKGFSEDDATYPPTLPYNAPQSPSRVLLLTNAYCDTPSEEITNAFAPDDRGMIEKVMPPDDQSGHRIRPWLLVLRTLDEAVQFKAKYSTVMVRGRAVQVWFAGKAHRHRALGRERLSARGSGEHGRGRADRGLAPGRGRGGGGGRGRGLGLGGERLFASGCVNMVVVVLIAAAISISPVA